VALIALDIPPGVVRNGTQYQVGAAGRWFDANLVRWREGVLMPVGGWDAIDQDAPVSGALRDLFTWRDNLSGRFLAIGSNEGLYVWTGASALVDITPDGFTTGRVDAILSKGYSFGPHGADSYGTARQSADGDINNAAGWSFDNWGQNLIALAPHDGRILEWALDTQTVATEITNAPFDNKGVLVTQERHLFALGADGDPRKIMWSDREDNTVWTPSATNTAGSLLLQTNGQIQTGLKVRGQILVFTTQDVHLVNFVGSPFVYGRERVSSDGGVASPRSVVAVRGGAVWFSQDGFFQFDGTVRKLASDVEDFVLSDINVLQFSKVVGFNNKAFSEVWWFYPSKNSAEPDRYVVWNYTEGHWTIGSLNRTAAVSTGVFPEPMLAASDGKVYQHEVGFFADGADITTDRFVESGALDIGEGERMMHVTKLIPDEKTLGDTKVTFKARFEPNGAETVHGPFTLAEETDVRFSGRQASMRIEGQVDQPWRVGIPRLEVQAGGKR